uniref:Transmembrane protein n=1 Tax=Chromera velia CCMP2878 TaxID=1169474 RepID=A0A0G4HM46_9ALVE|eukprot:Cvel_28989.t1-p1 / transcript=Cvel_28989.t1 / gene=Cvel_28989 / organism=Chromera_velia_CCMP2878 / gene_product=hypothetical protein / transcript_product=hypothetical protein / location=Cvel_scaffold3899:1309-2913(+) / protein_length=535 / sequence_SO=supercontig / SO=protein_coding / is_pseudo=false
MSESSRSVGTLHEALEASSTRPHPTRAPQLISTLQNDFSTRSIAEDSPGALQSGFPPSRTEKQSDMCTSGPTGVFSQRELHLLTREEPLPEGGTHAQALLPQFEDAHTQGPTAAVAVRFEKEFSGLDPCSMQGDSLNDAGSEADVPPLSMKGDALESPVAAEEEGRATTCEARKSHNCGLFLLPKNLKSDDRGPAEWYGEDEHRWSFRNYFYNRGPQRFITSILVALLAASGIALPVRRAIMIDDVLSAVVLKTDISRENIKIGLLLFYGLIPLSGGIAVMGMGWSPRTATFTWFFRPSILIVCMDPIQRLLTPVEGRILIYFTAVLAALFFTFTVICIQFPGATWGNHFMHLCRCAICLCDWASDVALGLLTIDEGKATGGSRGDFKFVAGVLMVVLTVLIDVPLFLYNLEHNLVRKKKLSRVFAILLCLSLFTELAVLGLASAVSPVIDTHRETSEEELAFLITSTVFTCFGAVDKVLLLFVGFDLSGYLEARLAPHVTKSVRNITTRAVEVARQMSRHARAYRTDSDLRVSK